MDSLLKKFRAAFMGILIGLKDHSIRVQLIIGFLVILFGLGYGFTLHEWMWILNCIILVILAEWWNTAIEEICNLVDENVNEKIRIIKDLAAGGVLIAAIYAVIIGCLILKGVLR